MNYFLHQSIFTSIFTVTVDILNYLEETYPHLKDYIVFCGIIVELLAIVYIFEFMRRPTEDEIEEEQQQLIEEEQQQIEEDSIQDEDKKNDEHKTDNLGLQTAFNINNKRNNTEDTSYTGLKRNKQKKELMKKDGIVRSEDIQGYRGDKNIDEILKFIGDKSSDSQKNKINSRDGKGSDNDFGRPKNGKMKMTKYNSVENVSTTVFQPMDSSNDESKSIKSFKQSKKKVPKQNQSSKKFVSTEQRLEVLSSKSQNTKSVTNKQKRNKQKSQNTKLITNKQKRNKQKSQNTKSVTNKQKRNKQKSQNTKLITNKQKRNKQKSQNTKLVTNKQKRNKQKSQNKLNATTSNFSPYDSHLLSQYTQPKIVKNKKRMKSTSLMTHSDKSEDYSDLDSVHSLPASSTPFKQPSYKEAPKTDLTKPACIVTTSEESIPTVTVALPQRNVDSIVSNVNYDNKFINRDVHVTYIVHESQKVVIESAMKTAVLNKVPTAIPPQSASFTVRVPPKKKQSSIMYNKYEVDTSLYFGFEIDQNVLCDSGNNYSPSVSIPMPIEYNYKEVILFIKQAWQDVEKEKINGRSNILEYNPE
ncbi:DNA ligase 1-like [Aphis gossypii]|uniref:DNA ligase 1-like n=1 Tax=Aphis gossypii TaxID=80765 RepID=UPI0021593658|nr:DNA ligase 1-like [Aphis gossypii]